MDGSTIPRIVFMGTAAFAVPSLERLVASNLKPVAVVTGPDRPRGRGQKKNYTPVKEAAIRLGIDTVLQPEDVKSEQFANDIGALKPDIIVVVAFKILPPTVYTQATKGAFNLHGSLLPRYRGAAPINRAVMAGEKETGVTTFFLEKKVDTGNIILQRSMSIGENETAGEVHDRMMEIGADVVVETVKRIMEDRANPYAQNDRMASQAPKIFKEDCRIAWDRHAEEVHNHIRGLSPYPGAWARHGEIQLKILRSTVSEGRGAPGQIVEAGKRLLVACGKGAIEVHEVQQESRRRMSAADFLRGYALAEGDFLE